jgi:hypothetical protein
MILRLTRTFYHRQLQLQRQLHLDSNVTALFLFLFLMVVVKAVRRVRICIESWVVLEIGRVQVSMMREHAILQRVVVGHVVSRMMKSAEVETERVVLLDLKERSCIFAG